MFTIRVPKETPGEHFEGLDMITKLLAPKGQRTAAPPLIQVIGNSKLKLHIQGYYVEAFE